MKIFSDLLRGTDQGDERVMASAGAECQDSQGPRSRCLTFGPWLRSNG